MSPRNRPVCRKAGLQLLAVIFACFIGVQSAYSEEKPPNEPIVVNGDNVEYYQEKKMVVGTGNVSITYKDVVLTCDKITVDLETRDSEASGNVKIRQKDAYFTGDSIKYNFDTRKGEVVNGYLNARPFYGKARDLSKEPEKDEFTMNTGYVTTCDLDKPHYRIEAKQVKFYVGEKVVAKHVFFYVGNIPIFYVPYWVQPLNQERKTHIIVTPGQSKDWGYYALIAYRYNLNDRSKGDILLDYRSKKGLAVGVNHYLDTKEVGKGAFKFYYTHENDILAFEKTGAVESRYRFQYRHRWDMPGLDTSAIIEFNKLSDTDVIKDYFYNEYEELGDRPDNYISVITAKRDFTTEFLIRFAPNPFYQVVERLPQYKIDILNYKIGNSNFYYNGTTSAAFLNMTYQEAYPKQKDVNTIRFDTYNELSYSARLFKALSIRPYAAIRETYYSRNRLGDTNILRTMFPLGVEASTKFYKTYDVETNFLGLDIHKLRHIITPTANYYYIGEPTVSSGNLFQYDEVDAIDARNGIRLTLENRLQTKRGPPDNRQSVDLATFIIGADYRFSRDESVLGSEGEGLGDIDMKLELIPYSWLYVISDATIDTDSSKLQTANFDFVANGGDKWALASGLRYQDTSSGISNQVTLDGRYKWNDLWRFRMYQRFDLYTQKWEEQQYTIVRDLHCWIAELTLSFGDAKDTAIWFILKLKAFPDYPIGMKQTYSRPRFGEAGAQ